MSQNTGLNRNTIDKYYTKKSVVDECMKSIGNNIDFTIVNEYYGEPMNLIIEPSAGNGAFISGIKSLTSYHKFYDIEPQTNEFNIVKQDYLMLDYSHINNANIHIIGNPPFGRQSSLAIKFIKKSCEFADSISFILPKSFKKESMKKHFALNFHLIYEWDLPKNSFLVDEKEYDVPCVFQIWVKKSFNRIVDKIKEPIGFKFVKYNEDPDISVRRIGVYAGKIGSIYDKSIQSHYFIKLDNNNETTKNMLKTITFTHNNTVGPKSISKQELIDKYNFVLKLNSDLDVTSSQIVNVDTVTQSVDV